MDDSTRDERPTDATDASRDEAPTGPPRPTDPYPQPVQEVVDPRETNPLDDRRRTDISGTRIPREDDEDRSPDDA
jgi:hypothetical protein